MRVFLPILTCLALLPMTVTAQDPTVTTATTGSGTAQVRLLEIGGVDIDEEGRSNFVNKADCDDSSTKLGFEVTGLDANNDKRASIAVWEGSGCQSERSMEAGADCTWLYTATWPTGPEVGLELPIEVVECEDKDAPLQLYFLALDDDMGTAEVAAQYGTFELEIDTRAPSAPTGVEGGSGETQISVKWEGSGSEINKYYVYWDESGNAGGDGDGDGDSDDGGVARATGSGECVSGVFAAGDDVDPNSTGISHTSTSGSSRSTSLDGSGFDSMIATVAVQAEDMAGNLSPLSETACIDIIPTTGFWEYYEANGGDVEPGCDCATPGSLPSTGGALPFAMALLALWVRRRSA